MTTSFSTSYLTTQLLSSILEMSRSPEHCNPPCTKGARIPVQWLVNSLRSYSATILLTHRESCSFITFKRSLLPVSLLRKFTTLFTGGTSGLSEECSSVDGTLCNCFHFWYESIQSLNFKSRWLSTFFSSSWCEMDRPSMPGGSSFLGAPTDSESMLLSLYECPVWGIFSSNRTLLTSKSSNAFRITFCACLIYGFYIICLKLWDSLSLKLVVRSLKSCFNVPVGSSWLYWMPRNLLSCCTISELPSSLY